MAFFWLGHIRKKYSINYDFKERANRDLEKMKDKTAAASAAVAYSCPILRMPNTKKLSHM